MRIMYTKSEVDEFVSIDAVPCWGPGRDEDNPDMYSVLMGRITPDKIDFDYVGDYLIDDSGWNGASSFKGEWIQFGSGEFPNWESVVSYLQRKDHILPNKKIQVGIFDIENQ